MTEREIELKFFSNAQDIENFARIQEALCSIQNKLNKIKNCKVKYQIEEVRQGSIFQCILEIFGSTEFSNLFSLVSLILTYKSLKNSNPETKRKIVKAASSLNETYDDFISARKEIVDKLEEEFKVLEDFDVEVIETTTYKKKSSVKYSPKKSSVRKKATKKKAAKKKVAKKAAKKKATKKKTSRKKNNRKKGRKK